MKKIVSFIIAICLMVAIVGLMPVTVQANDQIIGNGIGTSTITYKQQSEYSILIPERIDANDGQYVFQAGMLNIADNEKIYVTIMNTDSNGRIKFTHSNGTTTLTKDVVISNTVESQPVDMSALPNHCVGSFSGNEIMSRIKFGVSSESFDCDYPKAGNYTALVEFEVSLVE